jgi:lysophospholipase L1-like esterase
MRVNYQTIACWGDSQTFGARTYGCYPLHLARILNDQTRYTWQAINLSTNGHTVRNLWMRLAHDLAAISDVHQACVLIGANDVGNESPLDLFAEYYRQVLHALQIRRFRAVYCAEIPPIFADGHAFFSAESERRRGAYNEQIAAIVAATPVAKLVKLGDLGAECFCDPVHPSETGNVQIAERFARAIMAF